MPRGDWGTLTDHEPARPGFLAREAQTSVATRRAPSRAEADPVACPSPAEAPEIAVVDGDSPYPEGTDTQLGQLLRGRNVASTTPARIVSDPASVQMVKGSPATNVPSRSATAGVTYEIVLSRQASVCRSSQK